MCKEHSTGGAEKWTAIGTVAAAFLALVTVICASCDAREGRKQQTKVSQATAMSACMQEYFGIRNDAAKAWHELDKNATQADRQTIAEHYSERMYGLHFEEYHLFRQEAIPVHVYTVWVQSLQKEQMKGGVQLVDPPSSANASGASSQVKSTAIQFPPLDIIRYTTNDPQEDFHQFITNVLASKFEQIEALVKAERGKGGYD